MWDVYRLDEGWIHDMVRLVQKQDDALQRVTAERRFRDATSNGVPPVFYVSNHILVERPRKTKNFVVTRTGLWRIVMRGEHVNTFEDLIARQRLKVFLTRTCP